jgi:hypothetical protein
MHQQTGHLGICTVDTHLQTGHVGICTADIHLQTGHAGIYLYCGHASTEWACRHMYCRHASTDWACLHIYCRHASADGACRYMYCRHASTDRACGHIYCRHASTELACRHMYRIPASPRHHVPQTRIHVYGLADYSTTCTLQTDHTHRHTILCLQQQSTDLLRNADRLTCRTTDHSIDANPQASFTAADTHVTRTIIYCRQRMISL